MPDPLPMPIEKPCYDEAVAYALATRAARKLKESLYRTMEQDAADAFNHIAQADGETRTVSEWARILNCEPRDVFERVPPGSTVVIEPFHYEKLG